MDTHTSKVGVLIVNLGTPDDAKVPAVYRYLKEFLSDERVIDINPVLRWCLLNFVILPFRSFSSTHAYKTVWTKQGSPLLVHSRNLAEKLKESLSKDFVVELGMRYGNPSIKDAVANIMHQKCHELIVIPMFPQYASATNGSAIQKVTEEVNKYWNIPKLYIERDFYDNPDFIYAQSAIIKESINNIECDHILFSYHGVPVRHVEKSDNKNIKCDKNNPCPEICKENKFCYRAQCYTTSKLIAQEMGLNESEYTTSFQSRLGKTPWIKPYTDEILVHLRNKNIKHLAVACPSFVADCLETIEEIGMRLRKDWHDLGGQTITLVPCLNSHSLWVDTLKNMVLKYKSAEAVHSELKVHVG